MLGLYTCWHRHGHHTSVLIQTQVSHILIKVHVYVRHAYMLADVDTMHVNRVRINAATAITCTINLRVNADIHTIMHVC